MQGWPWGGRSRAGVAAIEPASRRPESEMTRRRRRCVRPRVDSLGVEDEGNRAPLVAALAWSQAAVVDGGHDGGRDGGAADRELELGFRVRVRRAKREQGERGGSRWRLGGLHILPGPRHRCGAARPAERHGARGLPGATVKEGEREGLTVGGALSDI